jgi:cell division transport system permease protein
MVSSLTFAPSVALQNFWRNKGLSMFAVSVMTVLLAMLGVALVFGHSFNQALEYEQSRASTLSVFMSDNTPLYNVVNVEQRLATDPRVSAVNYVSKARALDRFRKDPGTTPDMIAGLEGYNPLPSSLDVDVKNIKDMDAIANEVQSPLLDRQGATNYRRDVINNLILVRNFVTIAGLLLLGGLSAVAVFIIMMSIRTAVFVRRKEIEVMKLVGATDWFVRGPFLIEGMLAGLIASLVAIGLVAGGYHPFVDWGQSQVHFLPLTYDAGFIGQLCLAMAGVGMILGAFGSYLGVRRFLQA